LRLIFFSKKIFKKKFFFFFGRIDFFYRGLGCIKRKREDFSEKLLIACFKLFETLFKKKKKKFQFSNKN